MSFGGLLFVSGSQPWMLPWVFALFAAISLPLRVIDFVSRKWSFFLLDFCYVSSLHLTAASQRSVIYAIILSGGQDLCASIAKC